jgi:hypothetical protein
MFNRSNLLMSHAYNETNDISDVAIYEVNTAMATALAKITSSIT